MTKTAGRPALTEAEIVKFRTKVGEQALLLYLQEGIEAVSIRRLSRSVDCSPATLYAHFSGKPDILRTLWGHVLDAVIERVETAISLAATEKKLRDASVAFVGYWIENPERFRLVFMADGVARADVSDFMKEDRVVGYFEVFRSLVRENTRLAARDATAHADTLIAGLIGVAMCHITIRGYPWPAPRDMVETLVGSVIG
jgi:AcrR family transcriptional regulator